ncbi:hypothetical protein BH23VER1_BH23VER1_33170 [soil metagenome]
MIIGFPAALALAIPLLAAAGGAEPGAPEVRVEDGVVVVVGGPGHGDLAVWVDGLDGVPPVAGKVETEGGERRFRPRFGLSPGQAYRVTVGGDEVGTFAVPKAGGEPAVVEAVYPSAEVLPANLLKFYLHFSRPMGRGHAYRHLRLRDGAGGVIEDPFLELGEELWDPAGMRFTLFFDPGRVKRGLKPHADAGPVLEPEQRYSLEIDAGWKDARGEPMAAGFVKAFRTEAADRVQPVPASWDVEAPDAGTFRPLVVRFEDALDRSLLERVIKVRGVDGVAQVSDGEREWRFVPDAPWAAGEHVLEVGVELEDRAGNSVRKAFEVPEDGPGESVMKLGEIVEIPFQVVGTTGGLPVSWDVESGAGVRWHATPVGDGFSTPTVSGGEIFLTSQVGSGPLASAGRRDDTERSDGGPVEFVLSCLDRETGAISWTKRWAARGHLEAVHPLHNLSTPQCAGDGTRVVALFGTGQLVCLDHGGEVVWERHLGEELHPFRLRWGHASSPVVHGGRIYLLCDHNPAACLVALDLESGQEVWRADRGEGLRSYSTPVLAEVDGHWQVIVNSNPGIDGYDAHSGELLWSWKEFCKVPVPVPSVQDGIMVASRGYTSGPVMALALAGLSGEVDRDAPMWRWASRAPYVSSPLVSQDLVYLSSEDGQVYCLDAASGEPVWAEKLGTCFWSTPVVGDGKVFLLDESGEAVVLSDGRELDVLARNATPGEARGSITIAGDQLLVRTSAGVYCIGHQ